MSATMTYPICANVPRSRTHCDCSGGVGGVKENVGECFRGGILALVWWVGDRRWTKGRAACRCGVVAVPRPACRDGWPCYAANSANHICASASQWKLTCFPHRWSPSQTDWCGHMRASGRAGGARVIGRGGEREPHEHEYPSCSNYLDIYGPRTTVFSRQKNMAGSVASLVARTIYRTTNRLVHTFGRPTLLIGGDHGKGETEDRNGMTVGDTCRVVSVRR